VSGAKKMILHTGISILQFPEGVDFDGNVVNLVVGIAGIGNEHLMILANLAEIVEDEEKVGQLSQTTDVEFVLRQFVN
jgi:PTS system mannitol-specific IIC component